MNYKIKELATMIASNSLQIKPHTQVHIKYKSEESIEFIKLLILEISKRGGVVFTTKCNNEIEDLILSTITEDSINQLLEKNEFENKKYDIFISVGSNDRYTKTFKNNQEIIDEFKRKKMELEKYKNNKQWLLLNYPSIIDSVNLSISYEEYFKYAMDAMTYDFNPQLSSIHELKKIITSGEYVKIKGDNVDLEFYKNGIPAIELIGNVNLPDGEIYTAPIRNSVNGYIKYNVPSPKNSYIFEDIYLKFCEGKVIDFEVKNNRNIFEKIISIDEGAKYIGEFAFGFNPKIIKPMYDILYDEKLCRSFHLALGNAYSNAFNGNVSALHWDMIYLNEEGNNCDVFIDNKILSSRGEFVPEKLKRLNK